MKTSFTEKERIQVEIQTIESEMILAKNEAEYWLNKTQGLTDKECRLARRYQKIQKSYLDEIVLLEQDIQECRSRMEKIGYGIKNRSS